MSCFIGIDLGTSSLKAMAVDERGEIMATTGRGYPLEQPRIGWAEQDPVRWEEAVEGSIRELVSHPELDGHRVRALGVTGQMHGLVTLDGSGEPLYPCITWADRRTTAEVRWMRERLEREQLRRLANPVVDGFTAPKLLWLTRNRPRITERIAGILLPKDYIVYRLTGEQRTEFSDASATLLFDVQNRKWDQEVVEAIGLSGEVLPEVLPPCSVVGELGRMQARRLGLRVGLPIVAAGGDAPLSALANGIVEPGVIGISIGTAGQVLTALSDYRCDPRLRLHTLCHALPDRWYMMGAIAAAGYCLQWWRENFAGSDFPFKRVEEEAASVPAASEGLLFLPYINGERSPHLDSQAAGMLFGLTGGHGRAHAFRAIMEGVGFAFRENLDIMREQGTEVKEIRLSGGGARIPVWQKVLASILKSPVSVPLKERGSVYGAALAAAFRCGAFDTPGEAFSSPSRGFTTVQPERGEYKRYDRAFALYRELYRKNRILYPVLGKLRGL